VTKRLGILLLVVIIMISAVPDVHGANGIFFVGVNDSVPMYLSDAYTPYYKGNVLYVPYTVFNAAPGGVAVSYNIEKGSLALFTRAKRLVYDLNAGTVTDESSKVGRVEVVYRNGMLFIPATKAFSHFGLSTALLTSQSGCTVLRITDGSQQLENSTFIRKAETLISIILDQQTSTEEDEQKTPDAGEMESVDTSGPATVYMAIAGEAVNEKTLDILRDTGTRVTFFLTSDQIRNHKELVRRIYADGHMIGVTVSAGIENYKEAIVEANNELDKVLYMKSLMVLLVNGGQEFSEYIVFRDWGQNESIDTVLEKKDQPQLVVCRSNVEFVITRVKQSGANLLQLTETSRIFGVSMR